MTLRAANSPEVERGDLQVSATAVATPRAVDSRWLALIVLCAGMLMIVLDATIVNVALPSIQRDLGFSQSSLAWVVNAYLIAFGGLLLLAGRLGDLIGRKRMFLTGLIVFTAASLLCGASGARRCSSSPGSSRASAER
jgi:MFS family permease